MAFKKASITSLYAWSFMIDIFNYLRLTKKPVGLLVNFGERGLMCERYAYYMSCNECVLLDKNMNSFYE